MIGATPPIQQALDEGLEWTFVRKEVVLAVPGIREFLSECGNASHGTEQRQTLIQTMLQCHSKGTKGCEPSFRSSECCFIFLCPWALADLPPHIHRHTN